MSMKERRSPPVTRTMVRSPGPEPALMAIGFAVSWLAMLAHNLFELPLALLDIENSGPLLVALALFAAHWRRPPVPRRAGGDPWLGRAQPGGRRRRDRPALAGPAVLP